MIRILNKTDMEANELRIGNYVFAPNGEVCKVGYEVIRVLVIIDPKPSFTPIPLTDKWLMRFGFERHSYEDELWYGLNNFGIEKTDKGYSLSFSETEIKHVHQLQNLYFALTGKELTIK